MAAGASSGVSSCIPLHIALLYLLRLPPAGLEFGDLLNPSEGGWAGRGGQAEADLLPLSLLALLWRKGSRQRDASLGQQGYITACYATHFLGVGVWEEEDDAEALSSRHKRASVRAPALAPPGGACSSPLCLRLQ